MSRQIQASVKGNYTSPIFPPFKAHLDEQALWKKNSITSFPCGGLKQPGHRGSLKFHSTWVVMQIILEMAFFLFWPSLGGFKSRTDCHTCTMHLGYED